MEIEERNKTDGKVKLEWVLKLLFFFSLLPSEDLKRRAKT